MPDASDLTTMIPDNYLAAIGRVITQWSLMETILDAAIWRAASLRNDLGRSVTTQMQVMGKMDLLGTLLWQTKPALAEQFSDTANYVRNCLQGKRNTVTHGGWIAPPMGIDSPPVAAVSKFSARGRLVSQSAVMSVTDLEALALQTAEVTAWLLDFCDLLPRLKQRRGGLGHKTPEPQNPQNCATLRTRALQPPTRRRKVEAAAKPKKHPHRQKRAKN